MNRTAPIILSLAVIVLLVMLLSSLSNNDPSDPGETSLIVYCAAGIKVPLASVAEAYQEEYGVEVQVQYGGSGTLLSNLRVVRQGDLYVAADSSYIDLAQEQNLVAEAIPLSRMRPVIAISKGNPKGITQLEDLFREDVRISIGAPSAASIGKQTELLLTQLDQWKPLENAVNARGVSRPTVNEVANDVKIGSVDAGIVWDATVAQYPDLESVDIAGAEGFTVEVMVGILHSSAQPTAALRFARYLGARDRGLLSFKKAGFPPVTGDKWVEVPEIKYYSGGVNRIAIQDTLRQFEQREGIRLVTVFNGCGILTGQIKLGDRPDCYHTCDITFMEGVEGFFDEASEITENDMVIAVPKGNPLNIQGLKDLTRAGLRVGVTNEEQSALGALTVRLLKALGLYEDVTPNVVVRTPTADLLVNQIRTGSMDAAVVYVANLVAVRDHLDAIPIDMELATARQSFAIGRNSDHKYLVERLYQALHSGDSKERFQQAGFRWIEGAVTQ